MAELFGFEIKRKRADEVEDEKKVSFVAPFDEDGGMQVAAGGYYGQYLDMDANSAKDDRLLIRRYRDAAMQSECDAAIEDIVNEAIVADEDSSPVDLITDDVEGGNKLKKVLKEEFEGILKLLNFKF